MSILILDYLRKVGLSTNDPLQNVLILFSAKNMSGKVKYCKIQLCNFGKMYSAPYRMNNCAVDAHDGTNYHYNPM